MKPQGAPALEAKIIVPPSEKLKSREGQIQLAKEIGPVICAIFERISGAFDSHSRINLPNGKALTYYSHNENEVVYRCGAQMLLSIPLEFISSIHEGTIEQMDQLIRIWSFAYSGIDIPPELWCDNPHIDIRKPLVHVPKLAHEVITGESERGTSKERLVKKLLPPRIKNHVSDDTSDRGVQKLRHTENIKFPTLRIKKREIN